MRSLLRLIGLAVLVSACAAPSVGSEGGSGGSPGEALETEEPKRVMPKVRARILHVIDGDTFEARIRGSATTVRLIGIDAPEVAHPPEPAECFGHRASAFSEARLGLRRVALEYDVERIDRYGRTLVYAWVGRRLFNEDLVRMGHATVLTQQPNVVHVTRLVEAERKARRDGLGLWGACLRPVNTGADWRGQSDVG